MSSGVNEVLSFLAGMFKDGKSYNTTNVHRLWRTSARVGYLAIGQIKKTRKRKGAGKEEGTTRQTYEIYTCLWVSIFALNSENIFLESDLCQCFTWCRNPVPSSNSI